jgi:hypothetical protein
VLLQGPSGFRFVYDRHDAAQVSLASWLHAADAWRQIDVVPTGPATAGLPAGSLVAPDGAILHGMAAFRRLFGSVRTFWFVWPFVIWQFAMQRTESMNAVAAKR